MNLSRARILICKNWKPVFEAPGDFDRAAAALVIRSARETFRAWNDKRQELAQLSAKLKRQAAEIIRIVENADPQRSP